MSSIRKPTGSIRAKRDGELLYRRSFSWAKEHFRPETADGAHAAAGARQSRYMRSRRRRMSGVSSGVSPRHTRPLTQREHRPRPHASLAPYRKNKHALVRRKLWFPTLKTPSRCTQPPRAPTVKNRRTCPLSYAKYKNTRAYQQARHLVYVRFSRCCPVLRKKTTSPPVLPFAQDRFPAHLLACPC